MRFLIFTAFSASTVAAETVPPDLVLVAPLGENQLIVSSACSPEHCWHSFYLRKIEWDGSLPSISCFKPIMEFNEASDFIAASLVPVQSDDELEIHMVSSHDVFTPTVVKLRSIGACEYQIGKLPGSKGS